jgi:tRNA pseudouridine55 synthase
MDGIFNILKPPGISSFGVVSYLKKILGVKKIGHAGTLDPAATGVLLICAGNATKAADYLMDGNKRYRTELTLGVATDTQDSCGKVISVRNAVISEEMLRNAVKTFIGNVMQMPPMFSALHSGGKRLYDLARLGQSVDRELRHIVIHSLDIIHFDGRKAIIDVSCSRGTYIRTLCADIGDSLECGGHMSFLLRTASGGFGLDSSITLEDAERLSEQGILENKMIRVEKALEQYSAVITGPDELKKLLNGATIILNNMVQEKNGICRVLKKDGKFIGLGEMKTAGGKTYLKMKRIFIQTA